MLEMPGRQRSGVGGGIAAAPASPLLGGGGRGSSSCLVPEGHEPPAWASTEAVLPASICTALYSFLTLEFLYGCLE